METPRHRDDRLHRLRLDRKLVTGALCHVTANPLTRCHLVILLTTVVSVPSPNTVMHFEYPDPPVLPSNYSRRFEDEKTHTQKAKSERTNKFAKMTLQERSRVGTKIDVRALKHYSLLSQMSMHMLFVFCSLFIGENFKHIQSKQSSVALVACCYVTSHHQRSSLKQLSFIISISIGQELGHGLSGPPAQRLTRL